MTTKIIALVSLCPGAAWSWHGDDYADLEWLDANQQKPSEEAIDGEVVRLQSAEPNRIAEQNRLAAYRNESDPLFFKAQRGEATMEEWKAKIAEIKLRYPKA
jgi:hypothetical protein